MTHYPVQMAALASVETLTLEDHTQKETKFAFRAEAFLHGVEICNAYLELVDASTLQKRVEKTLKQKPTVVRDFLFENAMNFGLPSCAGNALGLDRVIALLMGLPELSQLYPIPFLAQFLPETVAKE